MPAISRGRFDLGWFLQLRGGEAIADRLRIRNLTTAQLVALGWISGFTPFGMTPSPDDPACLDRLFKRNGFSSSDAFEALGAAKLMLRR